MEQDVAIQALQDSINEINFLKRSQRFSARHTKWVASTLYLLEEIFGRSSRLYITFARLPWEYRGQIITRGFEDIQLQIEQRMQMGYLETAKGLLEAGVDLIKRKGIKNVYKGKDTPKESSDIIKIISLIDNKLRKVIHKKPESEDDLNNAIESLFIGADLDGEYSRGKISFQYSSKSYTPDFVFDRISTVVDGKLCKSTDRLRKIIQEMNDYIMAFKTKYDNIIFVVYDLGIIRDVDQFREDILQSHEHTIIKVIKH